MSALDVTKIVQYSLPDSQYFKEDTEKIQIFLHHTAGNPNAIFTYDGWKNTPDKIATCVAISGKPNAPEWPADGTIVQGYQSKYWAYHLGLKASTFKANKIKYRLLDKNSIGVEICNWGQLTKTVRGYETYVGSIVKPEEVCTLDKPFKGSKYYHSYTDAQIESVRQLLVYWNEKLGIPIKYKGDEIFAIDKRALNSEPGVYTHNSVRTDKVDVYPHPKLVAMLKSL